MALTTANFARGAVPGRHHGEVTVYVTDPRTRRTVARLRQALGELVRARTLNQVTVSELCRTAGVHRTTFYKHYVGVADFARAAFAAELDEAMAPGPAARGDDFLATARAAMVQLLEHVAAHRETFRCLLGPEGDLMAQRAIGDHLVARTHEALESAGVGSPQTRPMTASLLGFAALGMAERFALADEGDAVAAATAYCAVIAPWVVRPA